MTDTMTTVRYRAVKRLVEDLHAWPSADTLERLSLEAAAGSASSTLLSPAFDKIEAAADELLNPGTIADPFWTSLSDAIDTLDTLVHLNVTQSSIEPGPART